MKKSTYLIALALGVSTTTFAQNVGINTDGNDPDANTLLHLNNHSASSLDSALLRIENEKATTGTGVQIENSGTASSKWDIIVPGSSTDLRIKGNGSDHVTIQNDGDVGIGTTTPVSGLDVKTSMGYNINTFDASNPVPSPLNNSHNVILCNDGPYTVNLPAANTCDGRVYYIKNIDAEGDDITVDGNSTETIDGSETYVLDCENDVVRIISNGSNWFILDRDTDTGTCAAIVWDNATCSGATISTTACSAVSGTSINDDAGTTEGIEYNWTDATTSGMANTSTTRALVEIGGQCWMRYNMEAVPSNFNPGPAWGVNSSDNGWHGYYDNSGPNGFEGRLYLWSAAMNGSTSERAQGVCPAGWHIPSDCEWMYLENTLGMSVADQQTTGNRLTGNVGADLSSFVTDGTNNTGFSALISGAANYNGTFYGRGSFISGFWTSSEIDATTAHTHSMFISISGVNRDYGKEKKHGISVRCLKD